MRTTGLCVHSSPQGLGAEKHSPYKSVPLDSSANKLCAGRDRLFIWAGLVSTGTVGLESLSRNTSIPRRFIPSTRTYRGAEGISASRRPRKALTASRRRRAWV